MAICNHSRATFLSPSKLLAFRTLVPGHLPGLFLLEASILLVYGDLLTLPLPRSLMIRVYGWNWRFGEV
jgi:hypothetical protein